MATQWQCLFVFSGGLFDGRFKGLALVYVWGSRREKTEKEMGGVRDERLGSIQQKALWPWLPGSEFRGQEVTQQYPALQVRSSHPHTPIGPQGAFTKYDDQR